MERNAFINGRNIWSTWGAELMDGALEAILTPPPVKDYIENDSRLEHGIQITSSPEICKMDSRELTLPFFITGNSQSDYLDKYSSFVSELVKGKTLLVIAHRLNTIQNADQILVISDGQISQHGTHEELMEQPGIYQDFVRIRMNSAGWSLS